MTNSSGENLIEHLTELRRVFIRCFLALGIGFIPALLLAPYLLNILIHFLLKDTDTSLHYFTPLAVFMLQLKSAVILDIALCFPFIVREFWMFILPALYEKERHFIRSISLYATLLFLIGVFICWIFIMPIVIHFGLSFTTPDIKPMLSLNDVISLALELAVVLGLTFQFPLITYALINSRIVSYDTLRNKRPYIFIGILILAAILTPPDIISQLMLALPTYLLFEISLFAAKRTKTNLS